MSHCWWKLYNTNRTVGLKVQWFTWVILLIWYENLVSVCILCYRSYLARDKVTRDHSFWSCGLSTSAISIGNLLISWKYGKVSNPNDWPNGLLRWGYGGLVVCTCGVWTFDYHLQQSGQFLSVLWGFLRVLRVPPLVQRHAFASMNCL